MAFDAKFGLYAGINLPNFGKGKPGLQDSLSGIKLPGGGALRGLGGAALFSQLGADAAAAGAFTGGQEQGEGSSRGSPLEDLAAQDRGDLEDGSAEGSGTDPGLFYVTGTASAATRSADAGEEGEDDGDDAATGSMIKARAAFAEIADRLAGAPVDTSAIAIAAAAKRVDVSGLIKKAMGQAGMAFDTVDDLFDAIAPRGQGSLGSRLQRGKLAETIATALDAAGIDVALAGDEDANDDPAPPADAGDDPATENDDPAIATAIGVAFRSQKHVFSVDDILGNFDGDTYAEDPTIIDTTSTDTYLDKDGNLLHPIDSAFGFDVQDFVGATQKEHDADDSDFAPDYAEGWAGNIVDDEGDQVGLALRNAKTDTFLSGQPLGTWAAGLGGNFVKASTEHYNVMAALLSDQAYAEDPDALYTIDNDLKILDLEQNADGEFVPDTLHDMWVRELTQSLESSIAALSAGLGEQVYSDIDFNRDGVFDEAYRVGSVNMMIDGMQQDVATVDVDNDGDWDIYDSFLNGIGVADITDLLEPNESTTTYDIAYGDDYSVTLKDDGKLLYRWGTMIKRPNDIRMDVQLELPDEWKGDISTVNGGLGYKVTRAELVITHDITNNPNDQVRPEDYENENAIGRKPAYYVVIDPDDPTNELWVSPRDAYGGDGSFLPSYFKLTDTGEVDLTAGGQAVYFPDGELAGYRNEDAEGNYIGTVLRDQSLIAANEAAELDFTTSDLAGGYTNAWYISMDRDPFEWSYDRSDSPYVQDLVGFASREEAEAAGFTDEDLVSGPRWRLTANKFGQDIPGVEIPRVDNSPLPFQHDNIGYPVGQTVTTTLNLLDWGGTSPLAYSGGWTMVDPARLDENGDGLIDEGWSQVNGSLGAGDPLPTEPILYAVSPNGQELTADFFDVAFYVKGDRQDTAKLYDVQLVLEYETDLASATVYDYGDAPDDAEASAYYQHGLDGSMEAAMAQVLAGFYLGSPMDGVIAPDIDAEFMPLTDLYALGDDRSNLDDEGNAMTFLTPLVAGETAWMDITASVPAETDAYLFAWFDLNNNGAWDDTEMIFGDGPMALVDGSNLVSFTVPDYDIGALGDGRFFARFILSDVAEGVTPYRTEGSATFHGEVEDVLVDLYSDDQDVIGRDGTTWWAGLSDGDAFHDDNFGNSNIADWGSTLVADLNGDGIDDVVGYADGEWLAGVTVFDFDPLAYDPDDPELGWRFDVSTLDGGTAVGDFWALDFNGDGADELIYRNAKGRLNEISFDESFDPAARMPKLKFSLYDDILKGDFNGDGTEELAALKVDGIGETDGWRMLDFDDTLDRVKVKNWRGSWNPDDYDFVVGDYNADGKDDIAGRNSDGQWIVSLSHDTKARFTAAKNWITRPDGEVLGGGDVDGDGDTDLILYDAVHGQFSVGLADADAETFAFTQFGGIPASTDWIDMRLGDFNGDGLTDVAARDAATGRWVVAESDGTAFIEDPYGVWEDDTTWFDVMVGNFDAMPTIVDELPFVPLTEEDLTHGQGNGAGDGTGDGDGGADHGSHQDKIAPTPPDLVLNLTPDYTARHVFSTADVLGGYNGLTVGDGADILDYGGETLATKDGDLLYAIDSEFGFKVHDFVGAEDKTLDGVHAEGWAGDLLNEDGSQAGLLVANARTDLFQTPNLLGTWLVGMGGTAVKASTEHYAVMQKILSDQAYPGDEDALLPLDDDLRIVDYKVGADGMPELDENGDMVGDVMHGAYVKELVEALGTLGDGEIDFDRDGEADFADAYTTSMEMIDFDGVMREVRAVDLGRDGTIDYYDRGLNGFGDYGIADVLNPNESSVIEDIAVGDDYSVTLKDDGKLLYRWGNLVKRPNDVRMSVTMPLPDEWSEEENGVRKLFKVTAAELVVNHTVTRNPNDQLRPEGLENEAAIGQLPSYEVVTGDDGYIKWVSTSAYYAGDGTFYDVGTVLRDAALVEKLNGSLLQEIGATSSDLEMGFTNEWYTTMDREPFVAVLEGAEYDAEGNYIEGTGEYVVGPRWRLQPEKYGQDLPGVVIPQDPSAELPIENGEEKYEVGVDTTTVLNLLDWNGTSPLALSAGWQTNAGTVDANGLALTEGFDLAVYIKGDINPVTLYDAELVLSYEEVPVYDPQADVFGTAGDDILAGRGSNLFNGGDGADLFLLGYGTDEAWRMGYNVIEDFDASEGDVVGFVGYGVDKDNYNVHITQEVNEDGDLELSLENAMVATLEGYTTFLEADEFYFA